MAIADVVNGFGPFGDAQPQRLSLGALAGSTGRRDVRAFRNLTRMWRSARRFLTKCLANLGVPWLASRSEITLQWVNGDNAYVD